MSLLKGQAMHGYEMCKEIEARSGGYFKLKHSTLYPTLHKLESSGLIKGAWSAFEGGKPRKSYKLTRKGRAYFEDNARSWRELFESMSRLIPEVVPNV